MRPDFKLHLIDLNFQNVSGVIACYVVESEDGLILVDPGPSSTLGTLRAGLAALGLSLADVRHVLLTHVHLDHAGAAGTVAGETGATVHVHARGANHLARPQRLLASAAQIYGEHMDALWGEMRPVPQEQLRAPGGGEAVAIGGLTFEPFDTPGHAVHHLAWRLGDDLFCGDVAGIRLDARQSPRPPTPPPDIDLEAWRESVEKLSALSVQALHLTHFGTYTDVARHWAALLSNLEMDAERVRDSLARGASLEEVTDEFTRAVEADFAAEGVDLARVRFASPAWMSVQGLARYWQKKAAR